MPCRSLLTALICIILSGTAYAAAFQFYELGTPIIGTAGVGQAAVADDASTSYFNPAGMTALPCNAVMLGTQMSLLYANFSPSHANTISGNNGGSAGALFPGLDAYFVYSYDPKLKFGISLTAPYGGLLNYNDAWVGRYNVQQVQFYTLDVNPVVAYQITNWLSIGGGITIEYANLDQTVALPITRLLDGQANLKVDNFSPGFNLGVLLMPTPSTKIGAIFRSQIIHQLRGDITFLRLPATPAAHTKMVMPANVIASIEQIIRCQLSLLGEIGWAHWSSMRDTVIQVDRFSVTTPLNWHDTFRVGIGAQYQPSPFLLLQAGASYDSSPTSSSKRLPDLPMDRQIRLGAGLIYSMINRLAQLGLSYEYLNAGNASIHNTNRVGVLAGSYSRYFLNTFQVSLNVNF